MKYILLVLFSSTLSFGSGLCEADFKMRLFIDQIVHSKTKDWSRSERNLFLSQKIKTVEVDFWVKDNNFLRTSEKKISSVSFKYQPGVDFIDVFQTVRTKPQSDQTCETFFFTISLKTNWGDGYLDWTDLALSYVNGQYFGECGGRTYSSSDYRYVNFVDGENDHELVDRFIDEFGNVCDWGRRRSSYSYPVGFAYVVNWKNLPK